MPAPMGRAFASASSNSVGSASSKSALMSAEDSDRCRVAASVRPAAEPFKMSSSLTSSKLLMERAYRSSP